MNESFENSQAAFSISPIDPGPDSLVPPFKVGSAHIHRLEEIRFKFPLSMFGLDDTVIEHNWHWLFPKFADAERHWDMVVQSWIAIVDSRVIVIDPCVGNARSFPTLRMFDDLTTSFIERFRLTGIRPEDVDYVFCTHLHSDHCGWNTQLRDGHWVPTFPNARYVIVKREFDRWDTRRAGYDPSELHDTLNAGVFENWKVAARAAAATTFHLHSRLARS